ncbi:hypothetical protein [Luteolibacter sp. LG18]|uniref:hypothetical protein n=1 Tax=Luteolibacter sp. LG18 TaxID=2819286 RepID=UPI0030C6A08B
MTSIPIAQRRRFVAGIAAGWLVSMLPVVAAFDSPSRSRNLLILGWALGIVVLLITRGWERCLRKTFLPAIGQTPWCFRVSVMAAVIVHFLVCLEPSYQRYVPGAILSSSSGYLSCTTSGDDPAAGERTCGFEESRRSAGMEWSGGPRSLERMTSLRFHPIGQPGASGWKVLPEENRIVHENNGTTVALDGNGLLSVLEELSGQKADASVREACVDMVQRLADGWRGRKVMGTVLRSANFCPSGPSINVDLSVEADHRADARWWPWSVCGAAWLVMVVVVHLITRLTFGTAK